MKLSDWADANDEDKEKMQKELIDATKPQPLTPEQAKAQLMQAWPAFNWLEPVAINGRVAFVRGRNGTCKLGVHAVPGLGYRIQCSNSGKGLFVESLPDGEYSGSLTEAIAALRQAAAEQMAVLGLVAEVEYPPVGEAFAELREKFGDCFEGKEFDGEIREWVDVTSACAPIKMKVYQGVVHGFSGTEFSSVHANRGEADDYIEDAEGYGFGVDEHEVIVSPQTLAEQDKRTRHAIAEAVAAHMAELGLELPGIDGVILNCRGGLG